MKRYMQACLWSPIWFPAFAWLPAILIDQVLIGAEGVVTWFALYLFFSLIYGGIQYLIAMAIVWHQIDFEHVATWIVWVLLLPLIFTVIQLVTMLPFFVGSSDFEWLYYLGMFDLMFGYGYVLVWLIGLGVIKTVSFLSARLTFTTTA